jgi:hypothetical protein
MEHTDCPICRGRYWVLRTADDLANGEVHRRAQHPTCPCALVEETHGTHQGDTCGWLGHAAIAADDGENERPPAA